MDNKPIGHITHYFDKIGVAVIAITKGKLKVGERIHILGKSDFEQTITSMQVDHEQVEKAKKGEDVALKVDQPVKEHDQIFLVAE